KARLTAEKKASRAVVCPAEPRRLLLQAAHLAGALRAPLHILHGGGDAEFWRDLSAFRDLYAVGAAARPCRKHTPARVHALDDEEAILTAFLKHRASKTELRTVVVANPADMSAGCAGMSALAPWLACQKHA